MRRVPASGRHGRSCGWFWIWLPVGAVGVVLLDLLPLMGLLILAAAAFLGARGSTKFGLVAGAGLPLLYVAYINRDGPGSTCYRTATATGCNGHLNPIPWLVAGAMLLAVGVVAQARHRTVTSAEG